MLVYFAIILIVLIGFCGLAVDAGRVELRRLQLQGAADDAAVASAAEWQAGNGNWQATAGLEANSYLAGNNLPAASADTPVVAPATGPYAADFNTVQVTLHQTVSTTFLGILEHGSSSVALTVSAIARLPPCAYFFASPAVSNGNASGGYGAQLQETILNTTCPVWSRTGLLVDSSSQMTGSAGALSGTPDASQILGTVSPAVSYLRPQQPDPLGYLQAPVFARCDHTNVSYSSTVTISPGTWCGGLNASGATLNLQPGLYVITGGANWSNTTVNGSGVTLYFTQGGGSGFGTFSVSNQSSVNFSAPVDGSDGGLPGILVFLDRAWSGGNEDFACNHATFQGDGVMYSQATGMSLVQCSLSAPHYFSLVTANLSATGSSLAFSANYQTLLNGSPLHNDVSLVQ